MSRPVHVEVDGRPPQVAELAWRAVVNDGHYTTMQVRAGAVRGLALHLARLAGATREVLDAPLDGDLVRARVRGALAAAGAAGAAGASVRVDVFPAGEDGPPSVMVTVRPPAEAPARPQRLAVARYVRPFAHVKHPGTFAQVHHARLARRAGFDDALLVGPDGGVGETTVANVGFPAGDLVVWPDGPALPGITAQLLAPLVRSERRRVTVDDLGGFDGGAFLANSLGIAAVAEVDGSRLAPTSEPAVAAVLEAHRSVPWDPI